MGKFRREFPDENRHRVEGVATCRVAERMPASEAKGFVERPDANTTLQAAANVIHMPLKRVDNL